MFEWKEEYLVGHPIIDEQHKKLFQMGEKMEEMVNNHEGEDIFDELNEMFNHLLDYTVYHFETEEGIMQKVHYENLEVHQLEHSKFVNKLQNLDLSLMEDDQSVFALTLLKMVATWIFKHITAEDFQYRSVINN